MRSKQGARGGEALGYSTARPFHCHSYITCVFMATKGLCRFLLPALSPAGCVLNPIDLIKYSPLLSSCIPVYFLSFFHFIVLFPLWISYYRQRFFITRSHTEKHWNLCKHEYYYSGMFKVSNNVEILCRSIPVGQTSGVFCTLCSS